MSNQDRETIEVVNNYDDSDEDREDDNDDDDGNDDSWDEMDEDDQAEPTKCLFCDQVDNSIEKSIEHLQQQHHISFSAAKKKFHLDQYSYIKMINYIKTHKITADRFLSTNEVLWNDDTYMKPVEVDAWLMFDIEELKDDQLDGTASDSHRIECLEHQLKEKDTLIEQLLEQINQMKGSFHAWIERTETGTTASGSEQSPNLSGEAVNGSTIEEQSHVARIPIKDDESYFMTYAHFGIHYDMLSDAVRTNSYREAILKNRDLFDGRLVMDVGCGTAILSMFASQAGAKKVLAIDQSEIIYHAMDIAHRNKISNVAFCKGRLENLDLGLADGEKVDIIISEWMGYFLLFEGMLDSVIYARDKYLKEGGLILPNRCTVNLVGLGDEPRHDEYIDFWKNVYGFDMSSMQSKVLKEAIVEVCPSEYVISDSIVLADLNMQTVDYTYANFDVDFQLTIQKDGKFTGFVGYFDTFFELPQTITFSTGPHSTPTHWKQVVFYLKKTIEVKQGDVISGKFKCSRGKNDARALCIQINAFNQELHFSLS